MSVVARFALQQSALCVPRPEEFSLCYAGTGVAREAKEYLHLTHTPCLLHLKIGCGRWQVVQLGCSQSRALSRLRGLSTVKSRHPACTLSMHFRKRCMKAVASRSQQRASLSQTPTSTRTFPHCNTVPGSTALCAHHHLSGVVRLSHCPYINKAKQAAAQMRHRTRSSARPVRRSASSSSP